jgi:hypothetical protein
METKGESTHSTHRAPPPQGGHIARAKSKEEDASQTIEYRVSFGRSSEKEKRHEEKNETLGSPCLHKLDVQNPSHKAEPPKKWSPKKEIAQRQRKKKRRRKTAVAEEPRRGSSRLPASQPRPPKKHRTKKTRRK